VPYKNKIAKRLSVHRIQTKNIQEIIINIPDSVDYLITVHIHIEYKEAPLTVFIDNLSDSLYYFKPVLASFPPQFDVI
jgi:hypothetical protein